jgi:hypothetical protein
VSREHPTFGHGERDRVLGDEGDGIPVFHDRAGTARGSNEKRSALLARSLLGYGKLEASREYTHFTPEDRGIPGVSKLKRNET